MYLSNPKGFFWSWLSEARPTQACTAALQGVNVALKAFLILVQVLSVSVMWSSLSLVNQASAKADPYPLDILLRKIMVCASSEYLSARRVQQASMALSHLLASPVSPLNSSGRAALISTMSLSSSSLSVRGSMWQENRRNQGVKSWGNQEMMGQQVVLVDQSTAFG